jgi:hypothetical protein
VVVVSDVSGGCLHSLQTGANMATQVRRQSVPSTSFPVHCSLTDIPSVTAECEQMATTWNVPQTRIINT